MVQREISLQQGELVSPRDNGWSPNERTDLDILKESHFTTPNSFIYPRCLFVFFISLFTSHGTDLSKTIKASLRECVGIPIKEFALAVVLENGEEKTYSSTSQIVTDQSRQNFSRSVRRAAEALPNLGKFGLTFDIESLFKTTALGYGPSGMHIEYEIDSGQGTCKSIGSLEGNLHYSKGPGSERSDEDASNTQRKRPRYLGQYCENSNADTSVPVQKTQQLMIGDEVEVEKFYFSRFEDMQLSSCKVMGKTFVKLVEPKKQTRHPYTNGDGKAPPWWPPTTGENRVRHKEPDHLLKQGNSSIELEVNY
jgi:hypothetical protein